MVTYTKHILDNGLRVILHKDPSTPMVAVNLVYDVGSRDESADRTGFAHLFEHLMFSGSENVPDFDKPIQTAGGENNAFTNTDMTSFYNVLPAENLEVALWLESDRMMSLNINQQSLEVQQKVVVEEFKETCLNEPYGDMMHHMVAQAFQSHSYRWPTIGLVPEHISEAKLDDVRNFYKTYYTPSNAVLVVAGNIEEDHTLERVNHWFRDVPAGVKKERNLTQEAEQKEHRTTVRTDNAPLPAIYRGYKMVSRSHPDYYAYDLLSDALGSGRSSRLYQSLHKRKNMFSVIDSYILGSFDPGLFIIEGQPMPGISIADARKAIREELDLIMSNPIAEDELQKIKNKVESSLEYAEVNILHKAQSLAYYELLGSASLINKEAEAYQSVTSADIQRVAQLMFREENCCEVVYDV